MALFVLVSFSLYPSFCVGFDGIFLFAVFFPVLDRRKKNVLRAAEGGPRWGRASVSCGRFWISRSLSVSFWVPLFSGGFLSLFLFAFATICRRLETPTGESDAHVCVRPAP